MSKQTAIQGLLSQMREERTKLPLPIEWNRAYQAIEMMINHTYIPMEREQIEDAYQAGDGDAYNLVQTKLFAQQYYEETYGGQDDN